MPPGGAAGRLTWRHAANAIAGTLPPPTGTDSHDNGADSETRLIRFIAIDSFDTLFGTLFDTENRPPMMHIFVNIFAYPQQ
jgi:hypothetical protein